MMVVVISLIKVKLIGVHGQVMVHEQLLLERVLLAVLLLSCRLLLWLARLLLLGGLIKSTAAVLGTFHLAIAPIDTIVRLLDKLVHGGFEPRDVLVKCGCALLGLSGESHGILGAITRGLLLSLRWLLLIGHVDLVAK